MYLFFTTKCVSYKDADGLDMIDVQVMLSLCHPRKGPDSPFPTSR